MKRDASAHNLRTFDLGVVTTLPGQFANLPHHVTQSFGYAFEDIVVSCVMKGKSCGEKNVTTFRHPEFFNCYTFKLGGETYIRPGPEAGLTLLLYIGE